MGFLANKYTYIQGPPSDLKIAVFNNIVVCFSPLHYFSTTRSTSVHGQLDGPLARAH